MKLIDRRSTSVGRTERQRFILQGFYVCDGCGRASIATLTVGQTDFDFSHHDELLEDVDLADAIEWIPAHALSKDFPDVPAHIASPASEAFKCSSVGAHRGAIMLARAVVEATAKHHGITTGTLGKKIEAMFEVKLISQLIRDSAHEIRHLGNDMAHGDFATPQAEGDNSPPAAIEITGQDADEVLALMEMVLDEIYQKPAKVERLRAAREAKKAKGQNS
jgi:hypothetical protein